MSERQYDSIFTPDGIERKLNLEPSPDELQRQVKSYMGPVIPASELREFRRWPSQVKVKDQNGYGACTAHAGASGGEFVRAMHGFPHVPFSAWYLYGLLTNGRDQGSSILQSMAVVMKNGLAPESLVKYGDFSGRYSQEVHSAASQYVVEAAERCTTYDEALSEVGIGGAVIASVRADRNWDGRTDQDGAAPVNRGIHNHAILLAGGIKRDSRGQPMANMLNSWKDTWGLGGFAWYRREHFETGPWVEAYKLRVFRLPPGVMPSA